MCNVKERRLPKQAGYPSTHTFPIFFSSSCFKAARVTPVGGLPQPRSQGFSLLTISKGKALGTRLGLPHLCDRVTLAGGLTFCFVNLPGRVNLPMRVNFLIAAVSYGGPYLPRQNLLFHGKTYFFTAKLTFPRQNLLFHGKTYFFHGKTYFATAKLTLPRQNLLFHGKTYFATAKLTLPRQNLLFHRKTYFSTAKLTVLTFSTAKLTFPRQNLLCHGKTYFATAKLTLPRQNLLFHRKT